MAGGKYVLYLSDSPNLQGRPNGLMLSEGYLRDSKDGIQTTPDISAARRFNLLGAVVNSFFIGMGFEDRICPSVLKVEKGKPRALI